MTEGLFADDDAARVGAAVADTFCEMLGSRLQAFVVHGSAVTGYIRDFSDFDFIVMAHGALTIDDAIAVGETLRDADRRPFSYLQLSRAIDVDDPAERMSGLIDGAYVVVAGALPAGWSLHTDDVLRERGRESIERIPDVIRRCSADWIAAGPYERARIIRYLATLLKPALRAMLVAHGEPVIEVWRLPYLRLAHLLALHDAALGARVALLVAALPPAERQDGNVARELFDLLGLLYDTNPDAAYFSAGAADEYQGEAAE